MVSCSLVDMDRCLRETKNEGKRSLKIMITLSQTTRRHIPQDSRPQSYCLEKFQCHTFQFICLMCLIFLDVLLVFQTIPSDAAERGLFQGYVSVGDMGWKMKKHSSFSGRGQEHRCLFFRVKVAWARS